jgi:Flp pilus assembly pilin Flp
MSTHAIPAAGQPQSDKPGDLLRQLRRDEQGTTAVEFALISVPFVTMLLGIMSVCLYFFTILETENAVWQGSRDLRTGAYQTSSGSYNIATTGDPVQDLNNKKDALRQAICNRTRDAAYCMTRMRVLVQARAGFGTLAEPSCKDVSGNLISMASANSSFDAGGASSVVLITGCYSWELGGQLPFFKIGNMPDGSFLVQSSYAFRTEPYN